jgi:hypothetical protein
MKSESMKAFFGDLWKVLVSTLDGLVAMLVIFAFLGRSTYQYLYLNESPSKFVEGLLFCLITLLMLVRMRHDASVDVKVHWGSLVSVIAFAVCIFLLR